MPHGRCKSAHNGDAETSSSAVSVLCLFLFDVVCSLYTVKHKKNLTFYFWLQLWLILTNFYSFYIILIVKNSTCDCSKIYHITLIVCTPYFVNLNNNTKQLKRYYSLFIYIHSKREQKKSSPLINMQFCHFDIVILRVAIICNVQNVRLQRQCRPTDNTSTTQTGPTNNDTFIMSLATLSVSNR